MLPAAKSSLNFSDAEWINKPQCYEITKDTVKIVTEPGTDLWQRSYYGFRNDNAPCLLLSSTENFTFTCKVAFQYYQLFDQCGIAIYLDCENWFKASIEYENSDFSRLGSVVTNLGYSDWATTDIPTISSIYYRLSRRGPDFLVEYSMDGNHFKQMRIFHLHKLGKTTEEMGKSTLPLETRNDIQFGLYACSPSDSSFSAVFSKMSLQPCCWQAHSA